MHGRHEVLRWQAVSAQQGPAGMTDPSPAGSGRRALVYVLHSGSLYGTEKMGLVTVEALTQYDRRVILAPPGWSEGSIPAVLDAASAMGLEAHRYEGRRSLVEQLWRLFRQERCVDVITTSITQSLVVAALAPASRTRLRHLHAVHGGQTTNYGLKRVLAPLNVRFMAVSTHVKQILADAGVPADKIIVAENFLEDPDATAPVREPYGVRGVGQGGSPVRIAVVGRADPVKRLDMLVDAVATGELADTQIDVYGYGPDIEMLRERARPYDNLRFHGYDPDVPARLAQADLFVHTCDIETFGLVVLEAFRAGVVAVVPDAGGTGTLVRPDVTGLLYKARDVEDLVRTMRRAAALPAAELDRIAGAARSELGTRFSAAHGAEVYRQAFDDVDRTARGGRRRRS